jgi:predicted nucleic acid-binding protein
LLLHAHGHILRLVEPSRHWGLLGVLNSFLYEDAMIAATAQVHGLTVATRNVADFKALGFEVFNPFTTA